MDGVLRAHERRLWGVCYRMTGSAADADDLVQETFARALAQQPRELTAPGAWLTRVAMNLARDLLRRRRRTEYPGPWLPSPIDTGEEAAVEVSAEPASTEHRYDLLESVSFAFLLALEALTPQQRAVLLLRDVFDYSVRETSGALGLSEDNVRTIHLRARRAMRGYDAARALPTRAVQERNRLALERFFAALASGNVEEMEKLLAGDVRYVSDGGGEFVAARVPILGARNVSSFVLRILELRGPPDEFEVRLFNGFPGVVSRFHSVPSANDAPFAFTRLELDEAGRITQIQSVLASRKLAAVERAPALRAP
jgi:RNA polymerase sigma-70 factor (ECF subfamily)